MKRQTYRMSLLFDFYGDMLPEKQREFFDLYYNDDLSLSEIAENAGISRQGVLDAVSHAEDSLEEAEEKIGALRTHREVSELLKKLDGILSDVGNLCAQLGISDLELSAELETGHKLIRDFGSDDQTAETKDHGI